jgi:hypothetical protein
VNIAAMALAVAGVAPVSAATAAIPSASFGFVRTGSMTVIRNRLMAAAPLPDGKVLIAGGEDMNPWSTAELFSPNSGTFSADGVGSMSVAREEAVAAPLPNGDALVAGGTDASGPLRSDAELFNAATRKFSSAGVGPMTVARDGAAAAPLMDGRVLIVGGGDGFENLASAEAFDPKTLKFSRAGIGRMSTGRTGSTAALLPDGRVLVAGGITDAGFSASAEIFDPMSGRFSSAGLGAMTIPRAFAAAAPLPNGDVLIAGGISSGGGQPLASAELFDPTTGTFSDAGVGPMTTGRMQPAAAPLPDGDVLIAGGAGALGELSSAEIFEIPPAALPAGLSGRMILHTSIDVAHKVKRGGRVVTIKRLRRQTSIVRSTPLFLSTPAHVILARGSLTYATGTAELTHVVVSARRRVPSGTYSLTIRRPYGRRWLTTRRSVVITR